MNSLRSSAQVKAFACILSILHGALLHEEKEGQNVLFQRSETCASFQMDFKSLIIAAVMLLPVILGHLLSCGGVPLEVGYQPRVGHIGLAGEEEVAANGPLGVDRYGQYQVSK